MFDEGGWLDAGQRGSEEGASISQQRQLEYAMYEMNSPKT